MDERERRVKWLFKPRPDVLEDIDVTLLDIDDEDDRRLLIASEHPRFWKAIEDRDPEVNIGGELVNGELHLAMHQVVANRILADAPPEFWQSAQRLTRHGYRRLRAALWRLPGDNPPKRGTRHPGHGKSR